MTLTRKLKEAWLFGQLDTFSLDKVEARTETQAQVIAERFRQGEHQHQNCIKGQQIYSGVNG